MIEYYKKANSESKVLKQYSKGSWVNVIDPSEEEIKELVGKFDLEKDLVKDGLDIYEVPRIEEENGKAYIFLRIPTSEISDEYVSSFLVIVSRREIITVSKNKLEIFDSLRNKKGFFTNKPPQCLLQILLFLSNRYSVNIRVILKKINKNRRKIKKLNKNDILALVMEEDVLNDYLSSFYPLLHMHSQILKLKSIRFREDQKEFIEDLIVDLNQTLNSCKSSLKTISNMRDYYSTTLSYSLNKILTLLTVFTILLTVPTIISGIYGMNVPLPGQEMNGIFWILMGLVGGIWVVALFIFKKIRIL